MVSQPSRSASSGIAPPPAKQSSTFGGSPPLLRWIAAAERRRGTSASFDASNRDAAAMQVEQLSRSAIVARVRRSASPATIARLCASVRRAHHRCIVEMFPWRSDFSRADSALICAIGSSSSISRFTVLPRELAAAMTGSGSTRNRTSWEALQAVASARAGSWTRYSRGPGEAQSSTTYSQ